MITPPIGTPSFYTAMMENGPARFITGLLTTNTLNDITHVLITSQNITSDVLAAHELQDGIQKVMLNVLDTGEVSKTEIRFNPIYLPSQTDGDLYSLVLYDEDGDITQIDGFPNPFIAVSIKLTAPNESDTIDAAVNYKQFTLPPIEKLLEQKRFLLS